MVPRDFTVDSNWINAGNAIDVPTSPKTYRLVRLLTGMVIARISKQQGVVGYGVEIFRSGQWQTLPAKFDTEDEAALGIAIERARQRAV